MSVPQKTTVLVIGAGLSGLSAAKLLAENNIEVIVLEARDRVGGRTHTVKDDLVGWVDLGASYVVPGQNYILRLSHHLGIETYEVFSDLRSILLRDGKTNVNDSAWTKFGVRNVLGWFDTNYVVHKMEKMMEKIPAVDPWNCPEAREWDSVTLQRFYETETWTMHALNCLVASSRKDLAREPSQVSLLWALWYFKCCRGIGWLRNVDGGARVRKFRNGSMEIGEKLRTILGDRVRLDSQVWDVAQDDDQVVVTLTDDTEYRAEYVVVANPPPMQLKIHYDPPLPLLRNQLIQTAPTRCAIKITIYYKRPFWREKGYSGTVSCSDGQLLFDSVVDDCRPGFSLAALTVFAVGDNLLKLQEMTKEARTKAVAADLARVFESKDARYPVHYEEKNWLEERYFGGCYAWTFPTGVLTKYGKTLREPFQRVYFAGTETATSWPGSMNGAVQAGERAARQVLHAKGLIGEDQIWVEEPEFEGILATSLEPSFLERHPPSVGSIVFLGTVVVLGIAGGLAYVSVGGSLKFR